MNRYFKMCIGLFLSLLLPSLALAAAPTIDLTNFNLDWVVTEGLKICAVMLVVVGGLWAMKRLKALAGS